MSQLTSEQRLSLGVAARRYLRAGEVLDAASQEFSQAVEDLRDKAAQSQRFIVDLDHRSWLIQIDRHGDLDAECLERL